MCAPKFADMAEAAGLPKKLGYLPRGMKRGRLSTPAMVDEWMKGGSDA